MKKFAVCCLIGVLLASGMTFATETRVKTMGETGFILKDVDNIWFFPQDLPLYPDLVLARLDTLGLTRIGGHYSLGSGTLALYLSTDRMFSTYAPTIPDQFGTMQTGIDQKIDLFYARNLGKIPLGLAFSLYGNSYKQEYPIDKTERSGTGLVFVLGATPLENFEVLLIPEWVYLDREGQRRERRRQIRRQPLY